MRVVPLPIRLASCTEALAPEDIARRFVNGACNGQNTFLQDGVVINNWFSFNTGVEGVSVGGFAIPNPDAISEFKIQTSSYDAGYGRNPGANVNFITKS